MFRENLQLPNAMMALLGIQSFDGKISGKSVQIPGLSAKHHEQFTKLLQNQLNKINTKQENTVKAGSWLGSGFVNKTIQQSWLIELSDSPQSVDTLADPKFGKENTVQMAEFMITPFSLKSAEAVKAMQSSITNHSPQKIIRNLQEELSTPGFNPLKVLTSPQLADALLKELASNDALPGSKFRIRIYVSGTEEIEKSTPLFNFPKTEKSDDDLPVLNMIVHLPGNRVNPEIAVNENITDDFSDFSQKAFINNIMKMEPGAEKALPVPENKSAGELSEKSLTKIFAVLDNLVRLLDNKISRLERKNGEVITAGELDNSPDFTFAKELNHIKNEILPALEFQLNNLKTGADFSPEKLGKLVTVLTASAGVSENTGLMFAAELKKIMVINRNQPLELPHSQMDQANYPLNTGNETDIGKLTDTNRQSAKASLPDKRVVHLQLQVDKDVLAAPKTRLINGTKTDGKKFDHLLQHLKLTLPEKTAANPAGFSSLKHEQNPGHSVSGSGSDTIIKLHVDHPLKNLPHGSLVKLIHSDVFVDKISKILNQLQIDDNQPVKIQIHIPAGNKPVIIDSGLTITAISQSDIEDFKKELLSVKQKFHTAKPNEPVLKINPGSGAESVTENSQPSLSDANKGRVASGQNSAEKTGDKPVTINLSWRLPAQDVSETVRQAVFAQKTSKPAGSTLSLQNSLITLNNSENLSKTDPVNNFKNMKSLDQEIMANVRAKISQFLDRHLSIEIKEQFTTGIKQHNFIEPTNLKETVYVKSLNNRQISADLGKNTFLKTGDKAVDVRIQTGDLIVNSFKGKMVNQHNVMDTGINNPVPEKSNHRLPRTEMDKGFESVKGGEIKTGPALKTETVYQENPFQKGAGQNSSGKSDQSQSSVQVDADRTIGENKSRSALRLENSTDHVKLDPKEVTNGRAFSDAMMKTKLSVFESGQTTDSHRSRTRSEGSKNTVENKSSRVVVEDLQPDFLKEAKTEVTNSEKKTGPAHSEKSKHQAYPGINKGSETFQQTNNYAENEFKSTEKMKINGNHSTGKNESQEQSFADTLYGDDKPVPDKKTGTKTEEFGRVLSGKESEIIKNGTEPLSAVRAEIPRPKQIMQRITEQIKLKFGQKKADISIRLQPESLGKLNIQMQMTGKLVTLVMTAETKESKDLLSKHAYSLKENLASQGIKVEKIEIQTQTERNNFQNNQQNSNSARQQQQQSHHSHRQYLANNSSEWFNDQEELKEEILKEQQLLNADQTLDIMV